MSATASRPHAPEPKAAEAELVAATRALLDAWVRRGDGALERTLSHFAPDVVGIGSGADELAVGLDQLSELLRREHANVPTPYTYTLSDARALLLTPAAGLVHGDLELQVPQPGGEPLRAAYRLTCALRHDGSGWRTVLWQASRPDPEQAEGESLPIDALRARNEELERLVAERTADLRAAQAQLVHQEKMASLGALTAGIAHEIKNPLNFVTGFADLAVELADELSEAQDDERAVLLSDLRAAAARIAEHGARADAIVRSMMQHAEGGTGERQRVDLNALVAEYAGHARHALLARDPNAEVALDLRLGDGVGTVEAIPQEIGRAVVALLSNAFDAVLGAETDAPIVTVTTARHDGQAEVRVSDNGPGLAPGALGRVFEPFYTTKATGQGHTGLGLSLAHDAVVQGHDGTLTVESEEGAGAVFVVSLPAS